MSFDYGGVDIGATTLTDRATRELAESGEISTATLAALAANRIIPPTAPQRRRPASKKLGIARVIYYFEGLASGGD